MIVAWVIHNFAISHSNSGSGLHFSSIYCINDKLKEPQSYALITEDQLKVNTIFWKKMKIYNGIVWNTF